jgi:hypothetical protein
MPSLAAKLSCVSLNNSHRDKTRSSTLMKSVLLLLAVKGRERLSPEIADDTLDNSLLNSVYKLQKICLLIDVITFRISMLPLKEGS